MDIPTIIWEETEHGGYRGKIGTMNLTVFDIGYFRDSKWKLRSYLPGFSGRDLRVGARSDLEAFAHRVLTTWFRRAYGESFADSIRKET